MEKEPIWAAYNSLQFRVGTELEFFFCVALQLQQANCKAQWVVRVEHGSIVADTAPTGVDPENLQGFNWNWTPLMDQPLIMGPALEKHPFGIRLIRFSDQVTTAGGVTTRTPRISAQRMAYNGWQGVSGVDGLTPEGVLRLRFTNFDTENASNPTGLVYFELTKSASGGNPTLTIA